MAMEITKEKQLAAMLYKMASADGNVSKEEIDAVCRMATSFKDFDGSSKSFRTCTLYGFISD